MFSKHKEHYKEFVFGYCCFLYGKVQGKKKFTYHVKIFAAKLYNTEQKSTELKLRKGVLIQDNFMIKT